jgi:hypothetical protein
MDYWKAPIVPSAPVIRYNPFHIPWIAYLAPKLATGFVVPQGDMRIEHAQGVGFCYQPQRIVLIRPIPTICGAPMSLPR